MQNRINHHNHQQQTQSTICSSSFSPFVEGRDESLDKGQWLIEHRVIEAVGNSGSTKGRTPTTPTPCTATATAGGIIENPFASMMMFPGSMGRSFSTER
jgi:hypothetical protein